MQVFIESLGMALPGNRLQALEGRFHHAFERLARRIDRVHVSLKNVNVSRRGRNNLCMIRTDFAKNRQIVVRERSREMRRAIKKAIRRTRALIAYEFKRHEWRNRRPLMLGGLEATS